MAISFLGDSFSVNRIIHVIHGAEIIIYPLEAALSLDIAYHPPRY
jgi:hypothetical protein